MVGKRTSPKVSIGMPVFNGEQFVGRAIESLINQSFSNFELIISDNCSTDRTPEIIAKYAALDNRIRIIRQRENIGGARNFKAVLEEAAGEYFMWAAADDVRSKDFLEVNVGFLEQNPDVVASTSPNFFEGQENSVDDRIDFSMHESLYDRLHTFLRNCWVSHGMFYSLVRTRDLRRCKNIGKHIIAADWVLIVELSSQYPMNRIKKGYMISGIHGVSHSSDPHAPFQTRRIEKFFPLYKFSTFFLEILRRSDQLKKGQKIALALKLARINIKVLLHQVVLMVKK